MNLIITIFNVFFKGLYDAGFHASARPSQGDWAHTSYQMGGTEKFREMGVSKLQLGQLDAHV